MECELEKTGGEGNSAWSKQLSHGIYDNNEVQREYKEHQSRKKMRACLKFL